VKFVSKISQYKNQADLKFVIDAMRKAGFPENAPLPLPDKPSIAVLPFENMSGDPQQEYFSDGITEDIITAISKTPKMFVIARNSTFTYKGKPVKVQEVARDLGVRYVLEGSVRKIGERVRINAQLIDTKTGHHLWAEKYDRDLKNIFALQDEITKKIITALQVKLTEGGQARIRARGTDNLKVYLKILEASELFRHHNVEDNLKARRLSEEALELDPHYARTYTMLSSTHWMDVILGSTKSPSDSIKNAVKLSKKALSMDNSLGDSHGLLGLIYIFTKQYEKGMPELEKAVELNPNGADAYGLLGTGLLYTDRLEEAILMIKKAIRLNPIPPSWYLNNLAAMYRSMENYEEALVWSEKAVGQEPENTIARVNLCSIYVLTGRMEDARLQADEVMKLNPKFSLKRLEKTLSYKNPEVKKRYIEALSKAGLK
jgi:TolB-like protein